MSQAGENASKTAETARECQGASKDKEPCYPPVSFITFLLSLASSAMVHLGETPEPESGAYSQNLPLAKHTIDILAMLECKTRSNLTEEECKVLSGLLYELRMVYVKKTG